MTKEKPFTREKIKEFGVLSLSNSGWTKELNLISWNGNTPKIDLREWSSGKERMGRGITLRKDEAQKLKEILNKINFDEIPETETKVA